MSKPRKQHFVPQFYLRNFSSDRNQIGICSYNHIAGQFYNDVPIKSQAYKKYIYGEDGLIEKDLSGFEAKVATLFANPITKINPPSTREDFDLLRQFVLIQHSRTAKAGAEVLEGLNTAFDSLRPYIKEFQKIPDGGKFSHEYPSLLSLHNAIEHSYLMSHLEVKSIVNLSQLPFITSDNPITTYNMWMEQLGSYDGATGLAVKGIQIFVPICPRLTYCFYDPYIYDFGDPNKGTVATESEADVHQLNALQYLFSDTQLFFDDKTLSEYIKDLVHKANPYRVSERSYSRIFKKRNKSGPETLIQLNSFRDPKIELQLPFIRLTEAGQHQKLINGFPEVRHPSFNERIENARQRRDAKSPE